MVPGLLLYIGGVVVGLFSTDAPPAGRLGLALLWPLAPLAFAATIALLVVTAAIAFPLVGVGAAGLGAAAWWFFA
jgi:hypothetical protein